MGYDYCHSKSASVRVMEYILIKSETETFPRLFAPVHFTPKSESHKGKCHGGSMCAVMDDALGWMGFSYGTEILPWSGYTVQVNTSLKKPVDVGSILKLEAWVDRLEGTRKVWVKARLSNGDTNEIHCEGEGLFLKSPEFVE